MATENLFFSRNLLQLPLLYDRKSEADKKKNYLFAELI